ncbi:phosphoribosylformylglycinamidine synthase [Erysipelotrichaceae bacterium OttesenSCG-928-M19]|nr:phosphoribosylformylglycinamidine synthase [Erysipelotrichaceae bacterium OttesenSCG-928-M19]
MNERIYVEKKEMFQTTAQALLEDLQKTLQIPSLKTLRIIQIYDVLNASEASLKKAKESLFKEIVTDNIYDDFAYENYNYFCLEPLAGQFDQRADSAIRGMILLGASFDVDVKTSLIYVLNDEVNQMDKQKIINYLINPLETQLKDLSLPLDKKIDISIKPVITIAGFCEFDDKELLAFAKEQNLAMKKADLVYIQKYFLSVQRDPTITEILALDTYWSDHCRHTTFETHLENIDYSQSKIADEIDKAYQIYQKLRRETKRENKPMTLMDMASIQAKYQKQVGTLEDMEISEEVNACSIEVDVDVDGIDEKWLLMYKNETHNHPTEIEPFGGASTCLGGAIRDPLSGRAYVFQAMRITGSGDVLMPIEETRTGKLPQKVIGQKAAAGYSSYGNQIGVPATYINELYHPGYVAKRMELGAVVGAVKKSDVLRESPQPGDYIIMLGAPTGRDGVGGATGSSKVQDVNALEEAKAEVQKGNAPEERKLQRLFRNPQVTKLIKKANDLGAGGVSVAIGELADGVKIDLNALPTKYAGLNGTDLALSESQERMVVVIAAQDFAKFTELASTENVVATKVAEVTSANKLEMIWNDQKIIDIDREFLDTNGVAQKIRPTILSNAEKTPFDGTRYLKENSFKTSLEALVQQLNFASKQSLASIFDGSVGRTTVLAKYGGKYRATPAEISAQKIPVLNGFTQTVSMLSYGCNPEIGMYEPFYAGSYSIIEAVARLVATGANWQHIRLSLQEFFESVTDDSQKFGKPVAALLGALHTQNELNLPALGGKDSMSGTFEELSVPPTMVAFAITTEASSKIITPEFKEENEYVYALLPTKSEKVDYETLRNNFDLMNQLHNSKQVKTSMSIKDGGIAYTLANMAYGNNIGLKIDTTLSLEDLFYPYYGGFILTSKEKLDSDKLIYIGQTQADIIEYQNEKIAIKDLLTSSQSVLASIYPTTYTHQENQLSPSFKFADLKLSATKKEIKPTTYSLPAVEKPVVYIPAFMGTNCEYDVQKGFEKAGAITNLIPFVDLNEQEIEKSIDKMVTALDNAHIFALSGGFSAGDEPDGSGKYIVNVLLNDKVKAAINRFIEREGLIIGICNGFQVLIKCGLLPYGKIGQIDEDMPTLFLNERGKHVDSFVETKVLENNSPWLSKVALDETYQIAISHGEGRFIASNDKLKELFENNQVITQYVDDKKQPTMDYRYNPNGSFAAIEGIVSPDGRILGKMGHSERYESGNYQNIVGNKEQALFESAIAYFRKQ